MHSSENYQARTRAPLQANAVQTPCHTVSTKLTDRRQNIARPEKWKKSPGRESLALRKDVQLWLWGVARSKEGAPGGVDSSQVKPDCLEVSGTERKPEMPALAQTPQEIGIIQGPLFCQQSKQKQCQRKFVCGHCLGLWSGKIQGERMLPECGPELCWKS